MRYIFLAFFIGFAIGAIISAINNIWLSAIVDALIALGCMIGYATTKNK